MCWKANVFFTFFCPNAEQQCIVRPRKNPGEAMKLLPLSLMFALTVAGCGKKIVDKKPAKRPNEVTNTNHSLNPIPLNSDRSNKAECSVTQYDDAQRNISLSLFVHNQLTDEEKFFAGLIEGLFVRDIGAKIITETHKGEDSQTYYVVTDGTLTSKDKTFRSKPSAVTVCPDEGKYARGSVESAALNANYFISKTNRKVSQLLPDVKISPISIEIAPLLLEKVDVFVDGKVVYHQEAYQTDNAYYMPGGNSITFLPHSEEMKRAGFSMNFWEVPMVGSHEYGHHIFETLYPDVMPENGLKNCFGNFGLKLQAGEEPEAREVTNDDVLGALNEGFADLVAYYSLDNSERGLQGVPCLQVARDVGSKVFGDQEATPKVFSENALASFFATKEIPGPQTCASPNFQDIHIIGAIFANGVDRIMATSTDTKDQRLLITLKWLQAMKEKRPTLIALRPEEFLKASLKLFIETLATNTDGKTDKQECDIAKEIYPGIDAEIPACAPTK
jgi:hypothetical protein